MNQKPASFSSYQKFVILILALLQFTIILDFMILAPLGDILIKSLGMTPGEFGTVVSAYAISACVSGFLAAGFADKFDRKKLLLFFYIGFIAGTIFCAVAPSYELLLTARIVTGIFGGVVGSIVMAIITDVFELSQRGKVMGFVQMAFAGSQILGIPIGLKLATIWNWHAAFFMIVGLASVIGLMILWRMKPVAEHLKIKQEKSAIQHLWHTLTNKQYSVGFLATTFLSMGGFLIMPFSSAFLVNNILIPQDKLFIIFFFSGVSSMIIMPIIGKISDKVDKFVLFTVGSFIAMVMVLIYTNMSPVPIWVVVIINMVLFMGIMSRMVPATTLNSAVPGMVDRGAYMSVNSSLQLLAGGLASQFAGLVIVQETQSSPLKNFNILGYIMVGVILICIFFVYRLSELVKKKTREAKNPGSV
jgi:predicted MFS family arabinose efflux permease